MALCFGWIDGQVGRVDEQLLPAALHATPASKSKWSQINCGKALDLIERGLMRPAGTGPGATRAGRTVDGTPRTNRSRTATVPPDFAAALAANPDAEAFFATLTGVRRYAFLYRIQDAKRPETRARRIASFVELLAEGRTLN